MRQTHYLKTKNYMKWKVNLQQQKQKQKYHDNILEDELKLKQKWKIQMLSEHIINTNYILN